MNAHTVLFCFCMTLIFMNCNGEENPKYIGSSFGTLDLAKITFSEKLDTLFCKVERYYKLPKGEEQLDKLLNRHVLKDTLYTIYRTPPSFVAEKTYAFKNLAIKPIEVVDFYADHNTKFRKVEVSVYLNNKQYQQLRNDCKHFKDNTPANVKKVNNNKYVILQHVDSQNQIQTTLYLLDIRQEHNLSQQYFGRISMVSLKITNDEFYRQLNDNLLMVTKAN